MFEFRKKRCSNREGVRNEEGLCAKAVQKEIYQLSLGGLRSVVHLFYNKLFRCKMAAMAKLHKVIKPLSGDDDITAWLTKVELVATLSDLREDYLVKVISLYLEGGALAVYL